MKKDEEKAFEILSELAESGSSVAEMKREEIFGESIGEIKLPETIDLPPAENEAKTEENELGNEIEDEQRSEILKNRFNSLNSLSGFDDEDDKNEEKMLSNCSMSSHNEKQENKEKSKKKHQKSKKNKKKMKKKKKVTINFELIH